MATKQKTRKSLLKRFKITRNGKILRRPVGQDHYGMKNTGKQRRKKRKWILMSKPDMKKIRKLLA